MYSYELPQSDISGQMSENFFVVPTIVPYRPDQDISCNKIRLISSPTPTKTTEHPPPLESSC
jgi:hypothetical protein